MEITVVIKNGPGTVLHCDMQTFTELQDGDRIVVKKSIHKAKMLHPKTYDYFSLLRKNFAGISIHNVLIIILHTNNPYVKKFRNLELCFC